MDTMPHSSPQVKQISHLDVFLKVILKHREKVFCGGFREIQVLPSFITFRCQISKNK